jgi:hypothetical protein
MSAAFCNCVKVTRWDARASLSCLTDWVSEACGDLPSRQTLSRNSILVHIDDETVLRAIAYNSDLI